MERNNISENWSNPLPKNANPKITFPAKAKELVLFLLYMISGLLLCNSILYGGFHLVFAIFASLNLLLAVCYLLSSGCRLTGYSTALLVLSLCIIAGFARSDDGFVKFILIGFLLVSENLGLCLLAGHNLRKTGGVTSLLDVPYTLFVLGFGKLPMAIRGLRDAFRRSGSAGKKSGAILIGCAIALPILAIVISLLIKADAAFDALLKLLPRWNLGEMLITLLLGTFPAFVLYIRATALRHYPKAPKTADKARKGVSPLTVNTILISVAVVYSVYLLSQLAYLSGGFLGVLPEGYTLAEYARRGFFEMAWLCAINLVVIVLAVWLVAKQEKAPLFTRLLCLFIGIVTVFLVCAASGKMFLYIDAYGLTRLRVLTEVIMLWFALTTVVIGLWLFVPRTPYMKIIVVLSLLIGGTVLWADVDTVVARYNVTAYQSGQLESVDVTYLDSLGDSAVPYLYQLTKSSDPEVAETAIESLQYRPWYWDADYRGWNYVRYVAYLYLPEFSKSPYIP